MKKDVHFWLFNNDIEYEIDAVVDIVQGNPNSIASDYDAYGYTEVDEFESKPELPGHLVDQAEEEAIYWASVE